MKQMKSDCRCAVSRDLFCRVAQAEDGAVKRESKRKGEAMKLIHCADLHLDSSMTTHLTKEKAKERKAELLASF